MSHKRILMAVDSVTTEKQHHIHQRAHYLAASTGAVLNKLLVESHFSAIGMAGAIASLSEMNHAVSVDDCIVEHGDHVYVTDQVASDMGIDLVVLAEHSMRSPLLSRDDDKALLRNAHQDILFVKNSVKDYQDIVCVLDVFQRNARGVLKKAKQFAKDANASLHVVHMIGRYPHAGLEHLNQADLLCEEEEFIQSCHDRLQGLAKTFEIANEHQHVCVGNSIVHIKQELAAISADLLIMANAPHHHFGKADSLLPAKVVHDIDCDLLALYVADENQGDLKRFYYH